MDDSENVAIAKNVNRIGHLDLPGGGQVRVRGNLAIIGHLDPPDGTTILDVSDPATPRILSRITLDGMASHTHKARFAGDRDLMVVNCEMFDRHILRKGLDIPRLQSEFRERESREPTDAELAALLKVPIERMAELHGMAAEGYNDGGLKIYDISDPTLPRLITHQRTGGVGVHRFDCDARYAYISTEMEGYVGNIIVIYDIEDPANVHEVSRWHMPGQHVAGGETPHWEGFRNRVHHGLRFGDELWTACWYGGFDVIDLRDIASPRTVAHHNYHPPFPEPTHTVMPLPDLVDGRRIAVCIDEEHPHASGQPHAFLWVFDVTDYDDIQPLSTFHVTDFDAPWANAHLAEDGTYWHGLPEIYGPGAHQFQEHMGGDGLVYCAWFSAGLRIIDVSDPRAPFERGYFMPPPAPGFPAPQSNDVDVDENGIIYLIDRINGLDILELTG
jgi:hypothetical protein